MQFRCEINCDSRESIIEELKFFLEQVELDADGGGTDSTEMYSKWVIEDSK